MKIAGKVLDGPRIETLVIPRGEDEIVFRAKAVLDFKAFEELCKPPSPPMMLKRGGEQIPQVDDKDYNKKLDAFASKKTAWMVLKSLEATPDLTWDTVDMNDPDTWRNFDQELTDSGFSFAEVGFILNTVITACGLNQAKIEEATKLFLAGQENPPESA